MYQQSIIQQIIKNTWLIMFSLVYISGSQPFWKKCNVFRHLRKRESHRCWAPLFCRCLNTLHFSIGVFWFFARVLPPNVMGIPQFQSRRPGALQEMGLKSRRLLLDSGGLATRKTVTHSHTLGGEESEGRRNTFFLHKEENRFI